MNAQITEISNGFLITIVTGPTQSQGDILHNVGYIKELHELKGKILELTENMERSRRQISENKLAEMVKQNDGAAKVALSEGPRN